VLSDIRGRDLGFVVDMCTFVDSNTHAINIVGVTRSGAKMKFGCSLATLLPTFE